MKHTHIHIRVQTPIAFMRQPMSRLLGEQQLFDDRKTGARMNAS